MQSSSNSTDRIFHDKHGKLVIAQPPNLPLLVWGGAFLLKLLITTGTAHAALDAISYGALFTWAWLELFQGVNYFRRGLGLVVLIGTIISRIAT